jgi:hypothetical protein
MKKTFLIVAIVAASHCSYAQTNTFPSSGNAGVGTISPSLPLHINGTIYSATPISNTVGIGTSWTDNANYNFIGYQGYWGLRTATNTSYNLDVFNGGNPITAMTVLQGGNIGIGTASPLQKFTIKSPGNLNGSSSTDYDFGITDGATNQLQLLGLVNTSGQYGLLQVVKGGIGAGNLVLQTQGGNIGIGTTTPDTKLAVNGTIHSKEVKVDLTGWPDYVFKPKYNLPSLLQVKTYINQNHRLPDMPSEKDVSMNGINLGEIVKLQTKKIEELTLYLLEKNEQLRKESELNNKQQKDIDQLKNQFKELKKQRLNQQHKY